jgi:release factor glutamine methyltransferase
VANLPYLSDEMMETVGPDVGHEPRCALHGGRTGIELYEQLLRQVAAREWDAPLVLEIDPRQAALMRSTVTRTLPGRLIQVDRDYAGHERVVVVGADPA